MAQPLNVKAFVPYINGKAFPSLLEEFEGPERKRKTSTYRAGDMLAERKVNMGEEPREAKLVWFDLPPEILHKYGVCEGDEVRVRLVTSEESEKCDYSQHEYIMVGSWESIKRDTIKAGDTSKYTCVLEIEEYTENHDNIEQEYWNKTMGVHRMGGKDLTEQRRRNLELSY